MGRRCCCDDGVCDDCSGSPPAQLQVDFTGVVDGGNYDICEICATYYGQSFVLDQTGGDSCKYYFLEDDWCDACESGETSTSITAWYYKSGSNYYLHVTVGVCHCCGIGGVEVTAAEFRHDFGTSMPTCVPGSPVSLSPYNTGFWNANVECDWDDTVVTCSVSAV